MSRLAGSQLHIIFAAPRAHHRPDAPHQVYGPPAALLLLLLLDCASMVG